MNRSAPAVEQSMPRLAPAQAGVMPRAPQLRVAQIWRGEVMDERTFAAPTGKAGDESEVSLGGQAGCTFIIPDLGLPPTFHLLRSSTRGYMLTIGEGMTGQLHTGGRTQTITEFLSALRGDAGSAGAFRAVPVKPGDWGIVHIDGVGDHTFFFQFVDVVPIPKGSGDWELMLPALLFAGMLHGIMLSIVLAFFYGPTDLLFSSGGALTNYLVKRPQAALTVEPEPEPEQKAGVETGEEAAKPAATAEDKGQSGGEGDRPRARDPVPSTPQPRKVRVGLVKALDGSEKFKKIAKGTDFKRLGEKMEGSAGSGRGSGSGVGDESDGSGTARTRGGDGPGGGGTAHADIKEAEDIKTGGTRAPKGGPGQGVKEAKVTVDVGRPDGDFGDLTAEQIYKVVNGRRRSLQACFEAQLQRSPNLAGTVHIMWRINPDGTVAGARVKSSTLGNSTVENCLVRVVGGLKFPAPKEGSVPVVNFPFVFAPRK